MGPQQVLRAAAVVARRSSLACGRRAAPGAACTSASRSSISVRPTTRVRQRLATATVVAAGLDPVIERWRRGRARRRRRRARRPSRSRPRSRRRSSAFGELDCKATLAAARARDRGSRRRGRPPGSRCPSCARAWTYVLLCADRGGDVDGAMRAAGRLRACCGRLGPDPPVHRRTRARCSRSIPRSTRSPIARCSRSRSQTDVAGADDVDRPRARGRRAAQASRSAAGDHVIAAATGTRRGVRDRDSRARTADRHRADRRTRPARGRRSRRGSRLARRGAGARRARRGCSMRVHARVALVRRGDTLEAWGQVGRAEPPHRLGGEDGAGAVADVDDACSALIVDRVQAWNDHAPDPDQPLLARVARRSPHRERRRHRGRADEVVGVRDDRRRGRRRRARRSTCTTARPTRSTWSCTTHEARAASLALAASSRAIAGRAPTLVPLPVHGRDRGRP